MIHIATWTYGATNQTQTINQNISPLTAAMASMALTNPLSLDSVNATNGSSISPAYLINSTSMPVQSLPATGRAGLFKNVEHCSWSFIKKKSKIASLQLFLNNSSFLMVFIVINSEYLIMIENNENKGISKKYSWVQN